MYYSKIFILALYGVSGNIRYRILLCFDPAIITILYGYSHETISKDNDDIFAINHM